MKGWRRAGAGEVRGEAAISSAWSSTSQGWFSSVRSNEASREGRATAPPATMPLARRLALTPGAPGSPRWEPPSRPWERRRDGREPPPGRSVNGRAAPAVAAGRRRLGGPPRLGQPVAHGALHVGAHRPIIDARKKLPDLQLEPGAPLRRRPSPLAHSRSHSDVPRGAARGRAPSPALRRPAGVRDRPVEAVGEEGERDAQPRPKVGKDGFDRAKRGAAAAASPSKHKIGSRAKRHMSLTWSAVNAVPSGSHALGHAGLPEGEDVHVALDGNEAFHHAREAQAPAA